MNDNRKYIMCLINGYLTGKYDEALKIKEFTEKMKELMVIYGEDPKLTEEDGKFFEDIITPIQEKFMMKSIEIVQEEAYKKGSEDAINEINNMVTSDILTDIGKQNDGNH